MRIVDHPARGPAAAGIILGGASLWAIHESLGAASATVFAVLMIALALSAALALSGREP